MINLNANVTGAQESIKRAWENASTASNTNSMPKVESGNGSQSDFSNTIKAVEKYISNVDEQQQTSDMSIQELLSGKNEDITSVVSAVAKADMSFKLLVGVRNKLIEAYKQTMNMPV